jgi:serine/threonine protein phosphatase PrpC
MFEDYREQPAVASGVYTHVGTVRAVNEDTYLQAPPEGRGGRVLSDRLWAVADGMGGHNGGREASRLACRGLQDFFDRQPPDPGDCSPRALSRHLAETMLRVDRLVRQRATSRPSQAHMGTTLSCLLLADGHSIIAHVGDSRIYRWREGHLSCLTTDHTFVQEMIFEGEVDPAQAHRHPLRHLLTNAVGTAEPLCQVDERIDRVRVGDRFLLCTDGLTNVLEPQHLAAAMARDRRPGEIAEELVGAALDRKTRDNVTALVVALL